MIMGLYVTSGDYRDSAYLAVCADSILRNSEHGGNRKRNARSSFCARGGPVLRPLPPMTRSPPSLSSSRPDTN